MFVYSGEDTYASYKTAKLHVTKISKEKNKDIKIINEDDVNNLNDLLYQVESIDIFGSSPVFFAKRILNSKDIATYFAENIEQFKNVDLIIWQDKPLDSKTKIFKTLNLHKLVKNFDLPKIPELKIWLKEYSKKIQLKLNEPVINFILENVSTDKWVLEKELKKLSIINLSEPSVENIKEIFGLTVKGDLWNFLDYVGNRDKSKAINELLKLTAYEDTSQLIISLLQREFRLITQVNVSINNSEQIKSLAIPSFILKKTQTKSKNFTLKELKTYTERLFNLDYAIKSGEIDDKMGLTLFLLTL